MSDDGNIYPPGLSEARVIGRIVRRALDGERMLAGGTDEQLAALLGAFRLDIGTGYGTLVDKFRERRAELEQIERVIAAARAANDIVRPGGVTHEEITNRRCALSEALAALDRMRAAKESA